MRSLFRLLAVCLGIVLMGAAILAPQLGLDSNSDWGPSRRLLLIFGAVTIAAGWIGELVPFLTASAQSLANGGRTLASALLARSGATRSYRRLAEAWYGSLPADGRVIIPPNDALVVVATCAAL